MRQRMTTTPTRLRCAIADRRLLLVQMLAHVMASHPRIVIEATATAPRELDEVLRKREIDLLVVGGRFLDGAGSEAVERACDGRPVPDCIVLVEDPSRPRIPGSLSSRVRAVVGMSEPFETLQRAVDSLVDRGFGPEDSGNGAASPGLTPRQLEVLRLVGAGKTSREIAVILGISWRTVETHRKHIVTRLRAKGGRLVRMATWRALAAGGGRNRDSL